MEIKYVCWGKLLSIYLSSKSQHIHTKDRYLNLITSKLKWKVVFFILIRTILLDDEPLALISMEKHLQKFDRFEVIKTFTSVKDLLKEGPSLDFQVAFLDIEMKSMNGLDIAVLLKSWNESIYIVLLQPTETVLFKPLNYIQ